MKYLFGYMDGMKNAILSDNIVTSLAIGSGVLALREPRAGIASFFLGYAGVRTVNTVANAIGTGLMHHSRSIDNLSNMLYHSRRDN